MKTRDYILLGVSLVFALSPIFGPSMLPVLFIGAALAFGTLTFVMISHSRAEVKRDGDIARVSAEIKTANEERDAAKAHAEELDRFFKENGYAELDENRRRIEMELAEFQKCMERQCAEYEQKLAQDNEEQEKVLQERTALALKLEKEVADLEERHQRVLRAAERVEGAERRYALLQTKIARAKQNLDVVEYSLSNWLHLDNKPVEVLHAENALADQNALDPIARPNLKAMSLKDAGKEMTRISQRIDALCEEFSLRFQQKTIKSLFASVILYAKLELRGILEDLRYDGQEEASLKVRRLVVRLMDMLEEGNKTIRPAFLAFLGEVEQLGLEAVKVEYVWYVRREQQKQEQAALRERMREEREERIRAEQERKRIAEEEAKFAAEKERLRQKLEEEKARAAAEAAAAGEPPPETTEAQKEIEAQLFKVESNLGEVAVRKEEIAKLQNGKAGTVYVISNLGSFGDNVFKVGMTRRLEPQERVDELGDASVPFEFDVHSFIFSEDASGLEAALHQRLAGMRVNKINPRKEFFRISIDEIERIVHDVDPTADFNRTMLAEEYHASMSGVELDDVGLSASDEEDTPEEDDVANDSAHLVEEGVQS